LGRAWARGLDNHNCSVSELELTLEEGLEEGFEEGFEEGREERREERLLRGRLLRWANVDHLSGEAADLVSGVPKAGTRL
jgi:hypothetical protein